MTCHDDKNDLSIIYSSFLTQPLIPVAVCRVFKLFLHTQFCRCFVCECNIFLIKKFGIYFFGKVRKNTWKHLTSYILSTSRQCSNKSRKLVVWWELIWLVTYIVGLREWVDFYGDIKWRIEIKTWRQNQVSNFVGKGNGVRSYTYNL